MQETGLALEEELGGSGEGNLNRPRADGLDSRTRQEEMRRIGGPAFSVSALRDDYLEQH